MLPFTERMEDDLESLPLCSWLAMAGPPNTTSASGDEVSMFDDDVILNELAEDSMIELTVSAV